MTWWQNTLVSESSHVGCLYHQPFFSEPPISDTVNTTRVCISPSMLFVCILSTCIRSAFHSPLDALVDLIEFGLVRREPRRDLYNDDRVDARGNILIDNFLNSDD
jgi:hypothetical protein